MDHRAARSHLGLFFLLAVLTYLKAHERPPAVRTGFRLVALGAAALALASKSIVMGLPLVLLILDVYPLKRLGPRVRDWWSAPAWPVWREKIPFALLAVAAAAGLPDPAQHRLSHPRRSGRPHRDGRVQRVVPRLEDGGAAQPRSHLRAAPAVNPLESALPAERGGGLAITAAVWLLRGRWPAGLAIWAFYLVMLAPVAGIVHTGNHLGADRNTYVPAWDSHCCSELSRWRSCSPGGAV